MGTYGSIGFVAMLMEQVRFSFGKWTTHVENSMCAKITTICTCLVSLQPLYMKVTINGQGQFRRCPPSFQPVRSFVFASNPGDSNTLNCLTFYAGRLTVQLEHFVTITNARLYFCTFRKVANLFWPSARQWFFFNILCGQR